MKIEIYNPDKEHKVRNDKPCIFVKMTIEEAAATIASLARQIELHSPNGNNAQLETTEDGDFNGRFYIFVKPKPFCIKCSKKIGQEESIKLEKEGFLCLEHDTHKESHEKEVKYKWESEFQKNIENA